MSADRYTVLGLARARSEWFGRVSRWATSAAVPADFVKCVSAEELHALLSSGRVFSAALLDAGLPVVDRDLIAALDAASCPALVVDAPSSTRDWSVIGATATLPEELDPLTLLKALTDHAVPVRPGAPAPSAPPPARSSEIAPAPLAAICGTGGSGASVAAIALAQGLAGDTHNERDRPVLLADLHLRADQAMLHDARDIVPGVQELVEAYRNGQPDTRGVQRLTFDVEERGYHLLLGLRRPRYWPSIRPHAFQAALRGLRRAFSTVVCDIAAEFEGERETGSVDIEDRHVMSRAAVERAAAVFAVGRPGLTGLHALVRLTDELLGFGVPAARIVPVLNAAPRSVRARAELTRSFGRLVAPIEGAGALPSPVFLTRRSVEQALMDGVALPGDLAKKMLGAWRAIGAEQPVAPPDAAPQPVTPGSLGHWTPQAS